MSPYSTRKLSPWQEVVFASVLLAALGLVFFWPQAVQGKALYWGDVGLYFNPMLSFLHDHLRAGRFPLWNPWILCGAPYVGNPQTWPLYPFSLFLRVMSTPAFVNWTIIFHIWFAALGTFVFARHALARSVLPSLLAAVVFAFGGQLVSKEQFPNMVQTAAYLPWVLWMTHRVVQGRRPQEALGLGLVLGLQLLAAHAQMVLLTLYLSSAYGACLVIAWPRPGPSQWRRLIGSVALAGVVAFGLAAGQVLPTAELYRDAWRQRLSFSVVDRFYLPGNQLGNFILPALHGHPLRGDFTARGNFWETCCFIGWVAFALAVLGVLPASQRTSRPVRFWGGAAFVGILMALGGQTWRGARSQSGLYWVAYHVLPGFRNFHDPARCLLWSCFAFAVLAAYGLERVGELWTGRPDPRFIGAVLIAACFAELLHFGRSLYPLSDPTALYPIPPLVAQLRSAPAFEAHQARFLAPDTSRVWQRFTSHWSYRQTVPDYQSLWVDTLTPNLMMSYGLPDAYGYEPVTRRDVQTIMGVTDHAFGVSADPRERDYAATWAGFLSVRDVVMLRSRAPEAEIPGLLPVASETTLPPLGNTHDSARLYLSRNAHWQSRARLMTDFRAVDTPQGALSLMTDNMLPPRLLDLNKTLVLTGRAPFPSSPGLATPATIVRDEPDRVEITAQTTRPSILLLADTLHPGWQATVNGRSAPLMAADVCLRAVSLPRAGRCDVVFTDHPTSFVVGLYLTLVTVGSLCGCVVFALSAGRKKTRWRQESEA